MTANPPKRNVCVLVADGARGRLFRFEKGRLTPADNADRVGTRLRAREIEADKPGRSFDSSGRHRHALAPSTDARRSAEQAFAQAVAQWMDEEASRGAFDHLIVVAPPRALGELRRAFTKEVARRIIGTVKKELTTLSAAEVLAHIDPARFR